MMLEIPELDTKKPTLKILPSELVNKIPHNNGQAPRDKISEKPIQRNYLNIRLLVLLLNNNYSSNNSKMD